jgi:hypothetical protein
MTGLVVFWLVAAVGGYFAWRAQLSGEVACFGRRTFSPEQAAGPRTITRKDDPKAFHDALVIRWARLVIFAAVGAACGVAQALGISN